ncbi:hypothetical protein P7K49_038129 [Saguinus oedipus]|uniref:Uncharacterized protein n=1 Tax=Saguinus oedipus TaxID=9490 RepID=A0ABQ9TDS6_SAGOE|nr:hypothetical protein P7K49_038129 [Saguinus oedipus]
MSRSASRHSHTAPTPKDFAGDVRVTVMVCLSLPTRSLQSCSRQRKGQLSHVASPLCEWIRSRDYKKPPNPISPGGAGAKNDILGILWRWGDLMGCSPRMEQDPSCLENRQSKEPADNGRSSGEGKRGRADSGGEQKKRKATCHPGRFQDRREEVAEEGLAGNKYPDMALPV